MQSENPKNYVYEKEMFYNYNYEILKVTGLCKTFKIIIFGMCKILLKSMVYVMMLQVNYADKEIHRVHASNTNFMLLSQMLLTQWNLYKCTIIKRF